MFKYKISISPYRYEKKTKNQPDKVVISIVKADENGSFTIAVPENMCIYNIEYANMYLIGILMDFLVSALQKYSQSENRTNIKYNYANCTCELDAHKEVDRYTVMLEAVNAFNKLYQGNCDGHYHVDRLYFYHVLNSAGGYDFHISIIRHCFLKNDCGYFDIMIADKTIYSICDTVKHPLVNHINRSLTNTISSIFFNHYLDANLAAIRSILPKILNGDTFRIKDKSAGQLKPFGLDFVVPYGNSIELEACVPLDQAINDCYKHVKPYLEGKRRCLN